MKSLEITEPLSGTNHRKTQRLQSRTLVRVPRRLRIWARVALLIFVVFGAIVCFVPWTQTVTVQGKLSAYSPSERPQEIHAQINGSIRAWHINEGVTVKKGDIVLELEDVNPQFMAQDLVQRLQESRDALEQRRQAALERANILAERLKEMTTLTQAATTSAEARVAEANHKVQSVEQRVAATKVADETARLNLDRSRILEAEGLLSRRELELAIQAATAAEAEVKAAQASLHEAQQARLALTHNREQIDAELVQRLLDTRSQRASALGEAAKASKELADLELTRSNAVQRRAASRVVAPLDGTVVRLTRIGLGEIVHPGDLLFTIVPLRASPAVEMWVNAIDAPLLKPDRPVRLLFQGVPAIPLPAWPELMAGTYDGKIQVVDQSASVNRQFRLWVVPETTRRDWPPQLHIRQGTEVMGWVILNRVPLWYEIWRRVNLFPPDYESGTPGLKDVLLPKAGRSKK
ncbi:MAG: hemolysin secretion protein D [Nitrospirales bacterium]|nr:MAG: hemolysin secretion protein D [Nitrospirales bacterium]